MLTGADILARALKAKAVQATPELARVIGLPRKGPLPDMSAVTEWAKARPGPHALMPVQAEALKELAEQRGLFGPIAVGRGKTLITALAPTVVNARRPLLVTRASLVDKTRREFAEYAKLWRVHPGIQIRSYEMLGRANGANTLDLLAPDCLLFDECHRLKNGDAAVTRRVSRYMRANPKTIVVALSGTIAKTGLRDFAHILVWCLDSRAPVPIPRGEVEEWADALDDYVTPGARREVGALVLLSNPPATDLPSTRRAFFDRLSSSPGVVASRPDELGCSLAVTEHALHHGATVQGAFNVLRTVGKALDGWAFSEAVEIWAHARQLAMGFGYYADPRPSEEWLAIRSAWAKYVRGVLSHSRTLDSEKQVRDAVISGRLGGTLELGLWQAWDAASRQFKLTQKVKWLDDTTLQFCAKWAHKHKGIVWTEHTAFAEALATLAGIPYYGQQGLDRHGNSIETSKGGACVASISANSTGRNLQDRWHQCLVASAPTNGLAWQQMLARVHRHGQPRDEVTYEVLIACAEHVHAMQRAFEGARMQRDLIGDPHKLLIADYSQAQVLLGSTPAFTPTNDKE
jgi:hypothetical protein